MSSSQPILFEEYFEMGRQETLSPFITPSSRALSEGLELKASICGALLLLAAFTLSFFPQSLPVSSFLLIGVYFLAGIPSLIESIEDLINFEVNIDVLMTLAAFSSVFIGSGMEGGLLLVLFSLSGSMEDAVTSKAKSALNSLYKLSPTTAFVVKEDGSLVERSIKEITVQDSILVKSGQVVPLDGKVVEGISSVNLVHLTGENFPVRKGPGDEVAAGARNLEGVLTLKVARTSAESTLAKIIQLITRAQESRPKLQRWFEGLSKKYAITITLLSFAFALIFPFIFELSFLGVEGSLYRSLSFLIAASPCALIIALPIAYLSALSSCAKKGILLKGGVVLDALASCDVIAFDKTGTLTTGDLICSGVESLTETNAEEKKYAIQVAFGLEKGAMHPIAKALLTFAKTNEVCAIPVTNFRAIPGFGLEAQIESLKQNVYIGHPDYIQNKISLEMQIKLRGRLEEIRKNGELVAVQLLDDTLYIYKFKDAIRSGIRETLIALKRKWDMKIVMLTGDHEESAKRTARELGIETYLADLKPEDKLFHVTGLSKQNRLAMVGDGINDAPALARATVGICMGQIGATVAMEASDIVLLRDNIELLDWLVDKAKNTQKIVKQNLSLAIAAIFLASMPALAGMIPLWLAVVLHEGGTVLVGLNALRLLRK